MNRPEGQPAITEQVSRVISGLPVTEEPETASLRPSRDHSPMLAALVGSILIHLVIAVIGLALLHGTRRTTPRYLYVTLVSPGPANTTSSQGGSGGAFGQERRPELPKSMNRVPHHHRTHRRVTTLTRKDPEALSPVVESSSTVKPTPAPRDLAKADSSTKAGIFFENHGDSTGSQAGGPTGLGSAGWTSGSVVYQAPVLVSRIIPTYPERARRLGIEGKVVLRFIVDQSGRVEREIEVVTSLPMLDQAAIDAVRQWRFSPGRDRDGKAVRVLVSVPLQFTLR